MHSVLEELAVNSVLDLCCCRQMHLVIRDGSEEQFQGWKKCQRAGDFCALLQSFVTAESRPSRAPEIPPEIPCPVAPTLLPSTEWLRGLNFARTLHIRCGVFGLVMFLLFSSQFGAHIYWNVCPKLGAALQLTHWQSGRIASLLAQPSWLESPMGLIFITFY